MKKKVWLKHFRCPVCERREREVIGHKVKATCEGTKCKRVYKRIVSIFYKKKEEDINEK